MPGLSGGWNELSPESTYLQDTYARRNTISDAISIAENLGLLLLRTLSRSDLRAMLEAGDTAGISSNAQQSFRRADLVIAATDGTALRTTSLCKLRTPPMTGTPAAPSAMPGF